MISLTKTITSMICGHAMSHETLGNYEFSEYHIEDASKEIVNLISITDETTLLKKQIALLEKHIKLLESK